MSLVDKNGQPTEPQLSERPAPMSSEEIVEKVLMVTQHPFWDLYVTQLEINAEKYSNLIARGDFLEQFLAEYASLRSCEPVEVLGYARGLVYGLKLAGAMPYALKNTIDTQKAGDDAETEAATEEAAVELSEQGNAGDPGFRDSAHPEDLQTEEA